MIRFEIFRDTAHEYRWRLVAANNQIICWGEGYLTKQGAVDSVYWTKQWSRDAAIHDLT